MKTNSILIKEGKAFAVCEEIPKEPKYKVNCGGTHACTCAGLAFESGANRDVVDGYDDNCPHRYAAALQRVKDNAVLIREEDQDKAFMKLCGPMCVFQHGDTIEYFEEIWKRSVDLKNAWKKKIKEGELYPLSVEVEIIEACAYDCCPYNAGCQFCREPKKLARIVEEPEEKKPEFDRFNEEGELIGHVSFKKNVEKKVPDSEVEDQEEIWKDVLEEIDYTWHSDKTYEDVNDILKKFSITRIKQ